MNVLSRFLLILAIGFLPALAGCYTAMNRPGGDDLTASYREIEEICPYCPYQEEFGWTALYYAPTAYFYPAPWWISHPYGWWYDPYYYVPYDDPGYQAVRYDDRHGWDRGPGAPYVPGIRGQIGATPAPSAPAPSTDEQTDRRSRSESKPKETKEQDDKKRHGWRR